MGNMGRKAGVEGFFWGDALPGSIPSLSGADLTFA